MDELSLYVLDITMNSVRAGATEIRIELLEEGDKLTFKVAQKDDLWFHVKDIPGSHVILVTDGREPTDRDYTEAAGIAAGYSKATGDLVAVDYTRVRNIKKPSGGKPGFVTYKTNYTAFVKPIREI